MQYHPFLLSLGMALCSCQAPPEIPTDPAEAAQMQAQLSPDPEQARLWREAADSGAATGIESAALQGSAVAEAQPVQIPDRARPLEETRKPFPEEVETALVILDGPQLEEGEFSGQVRVESADGEFLVLDLGQERRLMLQAKVGGAPLAIQPGETAELLYRAGDPMERDDILALRSERSELVHALVGGDEAVRIDVSKHGIRAQQTGDPTANALSARVIVGRESRILAPGQQAQFDTRQMTVKILASVAVQGASANALPGRPYRLEILAWRNAPQ